MRRLALILPCVILAGLAGCSKSSKSSKSDEGKSGSAPSGGAASAEAAARGFLEAAGRRDVNAALGFVMTEADCQLAPEARRGGCAEYAKSLREAVPAFVERIPKGFLADQVKPEEGPGGKGGDVMSFLKVTPKGGGEPISMMLMRMEGRFYVTLPIRKKDKRG